jgi:hypothetical protein
MGKTNLKDLLIKIVIASVLFAIIVGAFFKNLITKRDER